MPAIMYRAVGGRVHAVGSAIIEDRGHLRGAAPASNGNYLFSEAGCGVQALFLIGTKPDIVNFLINRQDRGIENRIEVLPEIYMAIGRYVPGGRYRGLFPFQDATKAIAEGLASLAPGSTLTDLVGIVQTIKETHENMSGGLMKKVYSQPRDQKEGKWGGDWYLKFNYLQDRDRRMTMVVKKKLTFKQVLAIMANEWGV